MYGYLRDPDKITQRSFAIIRGEVDLSALPFKLEPLAVRLIHTSGVTDLVTDLAYSSAAAEAGIAALRNGAPVLTDVAMVAAGITRRHLPAANSVICTLDDGRIPALAAERGTTRSAAAVDLWGERMNGAVVAIGNAPTALFRVLELLDGGAPRPALIIGMAVGFVGAAESKDALIAHAAGVPYIALRGRRGGSAMAAAAVNALAIEASS